ncbi:MAG: hypothetical protein BGP03_10235 [Pseudonocardia sp. 73-21]|nr:MAG: hypothetical protein BGP03_10235 [Pseudonocardia sp. 73-21]
MSFWTEHSVVDPGFLLFTIDQFPGTPDRRAMVYKSVVLSGSDYSPLMAAYDRIGKHCRAMIQAETHDDDTMWRCRAELETYWLWAECPGDSEPHDCVR